MSADGERTLHSNNHRATLRSRRDLDELGARDRADILDRNLLVASVVGEWIRSDAPRSRIDVALERAIRVALHAQHRARTHVEWVEICTSRESRHTQSMERDRLIARV